MAEYQGAFKHVEKGNDSIVATPQEILLLAKTWGINLTEDQCKEIKRQTGMKKKNFQTIIIYFEENDKHE